MLTSNIPTGVLANGETFEGLRLYWSSNTDAATVGQAGIVTALEQGIATITAREGDGTETECVVTVVPAEIGPAGPSGPRYLLSEVQQAPYDTEPPTFHKDVGLVYQRSTDLKPDIEYNIWWINRASPLCQFIHTERGVETEQWFLYLGERMADAAVEATLLGTDKGAEQRPVYEIMEQVAMVRSRIIESFMDECGGTNQIVL